MTSTAALAVSATTPANPPQDKLASVATGALRSRLALNRAGGRVSYYASAVLRVSGSALKHGCTVEDVSHAYDMALLNIYIDPDGDPPKFLIIGPDSAGNLLELIGGEFADEIQQVWHAMACRVKYLKLLPKPGGEL